MEMEELRKHCIKCDEFAREAMKVFLENFIPCRQLALMYVVDNILHAKYYSIMVRETRVEDILGIISSTETELSREYGRQVLLDIDKMFIGLKWDKNMIQDYKRAIHSKMNNKKQVNMKVNDLINRQCELDKEKRTLGDDWDKLRDDFLDRPYVSEFLKMHNAHILNFDYLEMQFDVDSWKIDLYVWWGNCSEKEFICGIDPEELDKFMFDDNYMIDLLKEKSIEEEKRRLEKEEKKKADRYELYKKLKEEFESHD